MATYAKDRASLEQILANTLTKYNISIADGVSGTVTQQMTIPGLEAVTNPDAKLPSHEEQLNAPPVTAPGPTRRARARLRQWVRRSHNSHSNRNRRSRTGREGSVFQPGCLKGGVQVNVDLTQLPLTAVHKAVRLACVHHDGIAGCGDHLPVANRPR